jgi:NitT/TauT family transport system ATP-binding protein
MVEVERGSLRFADRFLIMSARPGRIIAEKRITARRLRTVATAYAAEAAGIVHELRGRIGAARQAA